MNNIDDKTILERTRRRMIPAAVCFVFFFVAWLCMLLFADGRAIDAAGRISIEPYKYLHNFIEMPYLAVVLLLGVVAVLWSIGLGWRGRRNAIWFGGAGTVLTVLALLLCAGWNDTAYYPSLADMQSSLTIYNSSSSLFTLKVISDRLATDPLRRSLHLVRMAGDEPQADHPRRDPRGRPPILIPTASDRMKYSIILLPLVFCSCGSRPGKATAELQATPSAAQSPQPADLPRLGRRYGSPPARRQTVLLRIFQLQPGRLDNRYRNSLPQGGRKGTLPRIPVYHPQPEQSRPQVLREPLPRFCLHVLFKRPKLSRFL